MAVTVIWKDGVNPDSQFTISDEVLSSLDSWRATMKQLQNGELVDVYPNVQALVVGIFFQAMVQPALAMFPTPTVQAAQAAVASAQQALAVAQQNVIPDFSEVPQA
jgi:hypothetical protein